MTTMATGGNPPRRNGLGLLDLPYFHNNLADMQKVRELMFPYRHETGHFLLRPSFSQPGRFTVSVMHEGSIKHFNILTRSSTYYLQNVYFDTVDDLIQHYRRHDVPNAESIRNIRLLHPIDTVVVRNNSKRTPKRFPVPAPPHSRTSESSANRPPYQPLQNANRNSLPSRNTLPNSLSPPDSSRYRKVSEGSQSESSRPPPLPGLRPSVNSRSSTSSTDSRQSIGDRPAPPLPPVPPFPLSGDSEHQPYYSCAEVHNKLPQLIDTVKKQDMLSNKCECGLDLDCSILPQEWTVHVSREADSNGRPFFMGPVPGSDEQQVAWTLPTEVMVDLDPQQRKLVKVLIARFKDGLGPPDDDFDFEAYSSGGSMRSADGASGGQINLLARGMDGAVGGTGRSNDRGSSGSEDVFMNGGTSSP